jgi:hypothetical protein
VSVWLAGAEFWHLDFAATDDEPLQLGDYRGATRASFTPFNGIDVGGDGRGCNHITGRFVVREIIYDALDAIERLAIDFEQHCEDGAPGLYGALRFNSTISTLVPFDGAYPSYRLRLQPAANGMVTGAGLSCGSGGATCEAIFTGPTTVPLTVTPDPGFLFGGWTPSCTGSQATTVVVNSEEECAALFIPLPLAGPQTLMFFSSEPGHYVGAGRREIYNPSNARWRLVRQNSGNTLTLSVEVHDGDRSTLWGLMLAAPLGSVLAPGTYVSVASQPSVVNPTIMFNGDGRGCGATGRFVIHEVTVVDDEVQSLAADFETACEYYPPDVTLVGSVRFNSTMAPAVSLAVQMTGTGNQVEFAPSGVVCVSSCIESFAAGASVSLIATPAPGWQFSGWLGDADCADGAVTLTAPTMCEAQFHVAVSTTVSPDSGSGASQIFTLRYTDPFGVADLSSVRVRFGASSGDAGTCTLWYNVTNGLVMLLNDSGNIGAYGSFGTGTFENNYCRVNLAASSATASGTTLTVTLAITFRPAFRGTKNIYMLAASLTGPTSGWVPRGTWTPAPDVGAVVVNAISISPNAGSGARQLFTLQYSDTFGAIDLRSARVRFASSNVGPGTCTISYDAWTGRISLLSDSGNHWSTFLLGTSFTLTNSQCSLHLATSSASPNGNALDLTLDVSFAPVFTGLKNVYMLAESLTGVNTGWLHKGTWTPYLGPAVVNPLSVSPSAGTGAIQAFTLQYTDSHGSADLSSARVRFGASNVGPGTCTVWYDAAANDIKLLDDAGVWGAPVALGSGTLANSQCSVNLASSAATPSGNTLTLVLQLTFAGGFTGPKNIYMLAASATGPSSGWIQRGTWTPNAVVGPAVVNPVSVTPNSGSGATQAFTLQYTDSLGASDLSSARVRFAASNVGPGTCTVWYDATTATIKLMDDAGVWPAPVALGSGTLANSQCALNLASSTATPNGTTLTLVLQITFAGGFTGLKNIYMLATSATGPNSGWIQRGTWTPNAVVGPAVVDALSVAPAAGSGAAQTFTLRYTDSRGATDLSSARVRFGAANVGPGTCTVWYDATANTIKLMDDAGTWGTPLALGTGTLSNSQCTLSLNATSATPNGNELTLSLNLAFSGSFAGQKTIFMLATSAGGANTGWQTRGTWAVPAALFRDDFNGSALNANDWFLPAGAGTFLGRTQLRPPSESLEVANGVVRLRLDTYNPTALVPGDSFWGSEIASHAIFGRSAGLTFSARARLAGPVPGGLVASVFSYMTQSGVRDEIDVELLSNDLAAPRLLTNVFDDNDFSHPGHPVFATIPGFLLTDFNLYQVDWLPDRVRWRVNGVVVREDLVNVPDDPMSIRLNLWAPASTFAAAYNASLQPVDNAAANQIL